MKDVDIEDLNKKYNAVLAREFKKPTVEDVALYKDLVKDILRADHVLPEKEFMKLKRLHKFNHKKSFLFHVYLELKKTGEIDCANEAILRKTLQIKAVKSWSGIVTITIFTSAYPEYTAENGERVKREFSCDWKCDYCVYEKTETHTMPRSYLLGEPAVLRASKNNFDCAAQIWDRMNSLYMTGHPVDKCELIISGGTWYSYPKPYREEFCRDLYYAVNTFWDDEPRRERYSLSDEKIINQTAESRVVGLTIETRPDTISPAELRLLRYYGVTRVQLGVQHIDDEILTNINRKCPTAKTIKALKLLKDNNYKIDTHWMPNLPGSSPAKDDHMLNNVLLGVNSFESKIIYKRQSWCDWVTRKPKEIKEIWEYYDIAAPELSSDTFKLYPTAILPYTELKSMYERGEYVPYDEKTMFDILVKTLASMYPWIRVARVIRDIPKEYMYNENTGADNTNMRQELNDYMLERGIYSMDIRNREVKNKEWDGSFVIVIRHYKASEGDEYFISAESEDKKTLYGFVRLRLDAARDKVFDELNGAALIRELHVYGDLTKVGNQGAHVQHRGIGRTLMTRAEGLAVEHGYVKTSVIAAEGNKQYYAKLGYVDSGCFMVKSL